MAQVDLVPLKADQLGATQAVAVHEQDDGLIAVAMPAELAGGGHEALDFVGGQVAAPGASSSTRFAGRIYNFPVFGIWWAFERDV